MGDVDVCIWVAHRKNKLLKIFTLCKVVLCVIPECTPLTSYPHFTSVFVVIFRAGSIDALDLNVLLQIFFSPFEYQSEKPNKCPHDILGWIYTGLMYVLGLVSVQQGSVYVSVFSSL